MNILDLTTYTILDRRETQHDLELTIVTTVAPSCCLHCGCLPNLYRHETKPQLFMDLPIRSKRVGLLVMRQRYKCRECGRTFYELLPDMDDQHFIRPT